MKRAAAGNTRRRRPLERGNTRVDAELGRDRGNTAELGRWASRKVATFLDREQASQGGRRGRVFSLRLTNDDRKRLEVLAQRISPRHLRGYQQRLALGPFLLWCAFELDKRSKKP